MTLARTRSVAVVGVVGHLVEVEADLAHGLPGLTLVGLPDAALSESRDRIRAAVVNSGEPWPQHRITLNLSPASLPKSGSGFDLALAVCVLAAAERVPAEQVADLVLVGELGLDGVVRPVRGVLPAVLAATAAGRSKVVVPVGNAAEAAVVPGASVFAVSTLCELIAVLRGDAAGTAVPRPDLEASGAPLPDLVDVAGHSSARFALEVAAAGGHHLLLHGPPGAGKTMLAERLPGLLPPLTRDQSLEVTAIHSVAGELPDGRRPGHRAAAARAASHGVGGGHRGRGQRDRPARGGEPGPSRCAVPGRGARVRPRGAGRAPAAAGVRAGRPAPLTRRRRLPGPLPAGPRREPVPVRVRHHRVCVPLHTGHPAEVRGAYVRSGPGPHRPAGHRRAADAGRAARRGRWRTVGGRPGPRRRRPANAP